MSVVAVEGSGWKARINISDDFESEWLNLEARVLGDSKELALAGAMWIMDNFGKGRTCWVRVAPEADTFRDFDAQKDIHKGYVRFSWENVPYHWYRPQSDERVNLIGLP